MVKKDMFGRVVFLLVLVESVLSSIGEFCESLVLEFHTL
jgi:hypothetical protein